MRFFDGYATGKICELDLLECVFADPLYVDLGGPVGKLLARRLKLMSTTREWVSGPQRDQATTNMLRMWVVKRLYRSAPEAVKTVDKRSVHEALRGAAEPTGVPLPYRTPNADHLRDFEDALADPWVISELGPLLSKHAVRRAIELGGFPKARNANMLTSPDASNMYGDGTEIKNYSGVREYNSGLG